MDIRLIVLRTTIPEKLVAFFGLLGLTFGHHQHGNSPMHYGTHIGNCLLEIYPLLKSQQVPDSSLRLGFSIDNFDAIVEGLRDAGVRLVSEPKQTEFGFMAIVEDPDGRKIELYKK